MKATELMIGDWVRSQDDLNRLKELQRLVDAEIERVKAIAPPVKQDMFRR